MSKVNGPITEYRTADPSGESTAAGFVHEVFNHLKVSVIATIVLGIIVSGFYPVVVWCLAQVLFHHKADGSLIGKDGHPVSRDADAVGSSLLGQSFSDARYFHSRPSGAGNGYDPTASGGSNLGPTSARLMFGSTRNVAYTVFAADKSRPPVVSVSGRIEGTVAQVTKTTIALVAIGAPAGTKTTYTLDPAVADPCTTVNFHGRMIHATTIPVGAIVELKVSDKKPQTVSMISVADNEIDGGVTFVDTTANKITLNGASGTVINTDPKNTAFVVNGKPDAKLDEITPGMTIHAVVSLQMDYDGIADRVIHYCQDNKIDYKSAVPDSAFTDADGLDDEKLVAAFNAAPSATITPDENKPIPADAVTASGSGLDPHISVPNATLQAQRVADARKMPLDKVRELITLYTDGPSLGFLGDAGVNVLRLNLALDQAAPVPPPPAPAAQPTAGPTTAP